MFGGDSWHVSVCLNTCRKSHTGSSSTGSQLFHSWPGQQTQPHPEHPVGSVPHSTFSVLISQARAGPNHRIISKHFLGKLCFWLWFGEKPRGYHCCRWVKIENTTRSVNQYIFQSSWLQFTGFELCCKQFQMLQKTRNGIKNCAYL